MELLNSLLELFPHPADLTHCLQRNRNPTHVAQIFVDSKRLLKLPGRFRILTPTHVNHARQRNIPSVYTTLTDLLDYLRQAYAPDAHLAVDPRAPLDPPRSFDHRWDLLVRCELLALDEIDEINAAAWAMERYLRLIDERWRNLDRRLTPLATNQPLSLLHEKIASRLQDGRALHIQTHGPDLRPYLET